METVNKLVDIIPIMKEMGSKNVAKAIIEEFHKNDTANESEVKPKSNRGRKQKGKKNSNIEVVK